MRGFLFLLCRQKIVEHYKTIHNKLLQKPTWNWKPWCFNQTTIFSPSFFSVFLIVHVRWNDLRGIYSRKQWPTSVLFQYAMCQLNSQLFWLTKLFRAETRYKISFIHRWTVSLLVANGPPEKRPKPCFTNVRFRWTDHCACYCCNFSCCCTRW